MLVGFIENILIVIEYFYEAILLKKNNPNYDIQIKIRKVKRSTKFVLKQDNYVSNIFQGN